VLVVHAGLGVEAVGVLQPTDLEVGREGGHRRHPARPQRPGDPGQHVAVAVERRPWAAGQPERALAQRNGGVELAIEPEGPGVGPHERGTGRGAVRGEVHEALADVHADDLDPPLGEGVRVAPRPTADVEQA